MVIIFPDKFVGQIYETRRCRFYFNGPINKKNAALRSMGDPCAVVKLSEVFSDCYAEQYDEYRKIKIRPL